MSLANEHRLLRSVDVAALVDCGCNIYVWKDGSGAEIEYCSIHKAAPDLLEALKATQDSAKMAMLAVDIRMTLNPGKAVEYFNSVFPEIARAIAKAEGGE